MDKHILPERSDHTEKVLLALIAASPAGLTMREMQEKIGRRARILRAVMRPALEQLVADEILEWEMRGPEDVYFLPWQCPQPLHRVVPVSSRNSITIPKCTWLSALGGTA